MTHPHPLETLMIQISTPLDAELSAQAVREQRSKSEIVATALHFYLGHSEQISRIMAQVEQRLEGRLKAIETQLFSIQNQRQHQEIPQSIESGKASLKGTIARHPFPNQQMQDEEEIDDEPDEILQDFLP